MSVGRFDDLARTSGRANASPARCRRAKGQLCANKQCVETCPSGTVKCGRYCCPKGSKCRNGKCCKHCAGPKSQCCDPSTEQCCIDKKTCCTKATELCCAVGATTANYAGTKSTCCKKPTACVRESIETGGLVKSSQYVCCPPDRQVFRSASDKDPQMCCPPGMVSKGKGKFILEAGGTNPFCCEEAQVCGDRCCTIYKDPGFAYANQTCCNGDCVALMVDRQNCGACGKRCLADEVCTKGVCVAG